MSNIRISIPARLVSPATIRVPLPRPPRGWPAPGTWIMPVVVKRELVLLDKKWEDLDWHEQQVFTTKLFLHEELLDPENFHQPGAQVPLFWNENFGIATSVPRAFQRHPRPRRPKINDGGAPAIPRIMRRFRDSRFMRVIPCSYLGVHPANRRPVHSNEVSEVEQVRNGGGDLSNRDGKREIPGEMRFEGPTSLRLTRETSSDYLGNGKLETEIADRPKAKNSEVIDVDNRSSKTMNYDPSGLRPARGGSNLREREQGKNKNKTVPIRDQGPSCSRSMSHDEDVVVPYGSI